MRVSDAAARGGAQGDNLSSIEPAGGDINDVCVLRDSGLVLLALDAPRLQNYFIPALGPAPRWCSFLDNLTVRALPLQLLVSAALRTRMHSCF